MKVEFVYPSEWTVAYIWMCLIKQWPSHTLCTCTCIDLDDGISPKPKAQTLHISTQDNSYWSSNLQVIFQTYFLQNRVTKLHSDLSALGLTLKFYIINPLHKQNVRFSAY